VDGRVFTVTCAWPGVRRRHSDRHAQASAREMRAATVEQDDGRTERHALPEDAVRGRSTLGSGLYGLRPSRCSPCRARTAVAFPRLAQPGLREVLKLSRVKIARPRTPSGPRAVDLRDVKGACVRSCPFTSLRKTSSGGRHRSERSRVPPLPKVPRPMRRRDARRPGHTGPRGSPSR